MRALIIGLGVVYVAGSALAKSIAVGPADCPVSADIASLDFNPGVIATDLNAANGAAEALSPIIDIPVDTNTDEAIFVRMQAEEAAVVSARWSADGCAAD